ncbi:MAG TPA: hypothetical protein VGS12_15015 [Caulobacteraceae bacterium]|nr:hypothetical protein [Caulobacteraceae bacterium]
MLRALADEFAWIRDEAAALAPTDTSQPVAGLSIRDAGLSIFDAGLSFFAADLSRNEPL